jgi:hypothetical protein
LASRRHGSHHAPDTPFLPVLRPPASCGWPQGAWCVRVPGNPREFRRPEGAGLIHGESALVTSSVLPRSVLSAVIAQRAPRRDPEGFPAAGRDGGNPRESTQKWSGAGRWICTRYCAREPLTQSGSRTEPAGGYNLERVCDLRFFVVRRRGGLRTDSEGSCGAKSPFLEVHRVVVVVAAVNGLFRIGSA